jgi:predicted metal-dependent HD superfamily phosphohydrolase
MGAANEKHWREFWQHLDAHGGATTRWQQLHAAYTEPWRAYHNLEHISHCLEEFTAVRQLASDATAIETAIWFHDAIYDTRRKDNEERCADLADAILREARKPTEFCATVRTLIMATKHDSEPTTNDARLLTDIDLAILGQSRERYTDFERQIRSEYSWVSDRDFAAGRSAILKSFLSRPTVYSSPEFIQKYEPQARRNLARAIKHLADEGLSDH